MSPTAKRPRSPRTQSPTTPTSTRSSAPTSPTRSRSSPTTCRCEDPRRRPELLRVRRRRALRDPHRQRRRRPSRHHLPVPVHDRGRATRTRSSTTPARSRRSTARTGTAGSSTRSPVDRTATRPHAEHDGRSAPRPGLPAVQHRAAVDAGLRRAGAARRSTTCPAAARCSPASGPRASSSTSARSSTSATCGRSRTCTSIADLGRRRVSTRPTTLNVHSIAIQVPITRRSPATARCRPTR